MKSNNVLRNVSYVIVIIDSFPHAAQQQRLRRIPKIKNSVSFSNGPRYSQIRLSPMIMLTSCRPALGGRIVCKTDLNCIVIRKVTVMLVC